MSWCFSKTVSRTTSWKRNSKDGDWTGYFGNWPHPGLSGKQLTFLFFITGHQGKHTGSLPHKPYLTLVFLLHCGKWPSFLPGWVQLKMGEKYKWAMYTCSHTDIVLWYGTNEVDGASGLMELSHISVGFFSYVQHPEVPPAVTGWSCSTPGYCWATSGSSGNNFMQQRQRTGMQFPRG